MWYCIESIYCVKKGGLRCSISAAGRVTGDRLRRERQDETLEEEEAVTCAVRHFTLLARWKRAKYVATSTMELAALVALTLLLGALVGLVVLAVGRRKEEIRVEEQAAENAGKKPARYG